MIRNPLQFIESARIPEFDQSVRAGPESAFEQALNLDKLPAVVVSGNTLIDYSATNVRARAGLSLALTFANQVALAGLGKDADEDDRFAAYKSNLSHLGFNVSPGTFVLSKFKKRSVAVHKAIIPFLIAALGGAAVGPVLIALLENLQEMDSKEPWITLFDSQARMFETREIHFAVAASDSGETRIRHVAARLQFVEQTTNVLFFKISDMSAEFESATTTLSIENQLLATIEPALREKMGRSALEFIMSAKTRSTAAGG